jgi:hypothetical protein
MSRKTLRFAQILWPAFLVAGLLEVVVFSVVDPTALSFGGWAPEAQTIYSLAFFVFWGLVAAASAISHTIMSPPQKTIKRRRGGATA